ncbi:MAG: ABC transporter ATP-binding protein [Deferribacteres bacterium]|nr:ABC transporter ATP-binding protein [Deferribacteres bacterium]
MAGLKIRNLKKSFGGNAVINNISFDVREGEFCILLGPSGCGKTTVLRLIAGLEHQDEGEIFIGDREVSGLTPGERDIAMVFQSYALYPHLSVYENMAFPLKIKKRPREETDRKVREAAGLLGIEELLHRKPKELSGGQRQRVAIGRAIVRNPELFLFDEPLSNLDAKLRGSMRVELAKLHQKLGATMVYVTHDQVEAMTLGEKIILLDRGEIQQTGTPRQIYEKPSNLFVATFIGSPPINLLRGRIIMEGGRIFFSSGELLIDTGSREELQQYAGREVTMGIRPESLTPGDGPVKGRVELVEHLGAETLVYVRVDGTRVIAKASPDFERKPGEEISLALSDTGIHFFCNGHRIGRP